MVRLHYLLLVPWIVFSFPSQVFLGGETLAALVIPAIGLAGMLARKPALATLASVALLALLVAGKVGTDLARAPAPDTAYLLLQFVAVIFFMEASKVVLSFDGQYREVAVKTDALSQTVRTRLEMWAKDQLNRQARLMAGALGLSLILLVLGGIISIPVNQPTLSGVLVLFVVVILLFLITQTREPESGSDAAR